jgi:hypothetical protein
MYVMYYASMLQCWQLIMILIRTNHPCLRVGCHRLSVPGRLYRCRGLGKRRHLMPDLTRRGHKRPRTPGSRYPSAGIHPITS